MNTRLKADALAKAALQATARALHTAQLALDAYTMAAEAEAPEARSLNMESRILMTGLRDGLLDAYGNVPDAAKQRLLACRATITSDELIDLLALCVRG